MVLTMVLAMVLTPCKTLYRWICLKISCLFTTKHINTNMSAHGRGKISDFFKQTITQSYKGFVPTTNQKPFSWGTHE